MAPQDDLTAERAAAEQAYKAVTYSQASCECAGIDFQDWPTDIRAACGYCRVIDKMVEVLRQTRQEALREAAKVAIEHKDEAVWQDLSGGYTAQLIAEKLDRLASEGG